MTEYFNKKAEERIAKVKRDLYTSGIQPVVIKVDRLKIDRATLPSVLRFHNNYYEKSMHPDRNQRRHKNQELKHLFNPEGVEV